MLFIALSVLDIIAGAAIYNSAVMRFLSGVLWMVIIVVLFKGFYSIVSSFAAGYFFEWPGILDMIAGTSLFLLSYDIVSASHLIGGLVMGKGAYYLVRAVVGV